MLLQSCRDIRASFNSEPFVHRGPSSEDISLSHVCSHIMLQEQDSGLPSMSRTAMLVRMRWNADSAKEVIMLFFRLRTRRRGIPLNGDPWIPQIWLLSICNVNDPLLIQILPYSMERGAS